MSLTRGMNSNNNSSSNNNSDRNQIIQTVMNQTKKLVNENKKYTRNISTDSDIITIKKKILSDGSNEHTINLEASLKDLNDVDFKTPANNSYLTYNEDTQKWSSKAPLTNPPLGSIANQGYPFKTIGPSIHTNYEILYGPVINNNSKFS